MIEPKTPEQIVEDAKQSKAALKLARRSKIRGMQDLNNGIYTFIFKVYEREKVPVDKFGHFYSKGGMLVSDLVSPDFSDNDFLLALALENNRLLKDLGGVKKSK